MTVTSPTRRPVRPAQRRATRPRPVAPTGGGLRRRLRLSGTPGRLRALLVGLVLLGLGAGLAGVIGVEQRSGLVDQVSTSRGPLTVQAQSLYRSLSDADATAAAAFLSNGTEPPALRTRYLDDIAAATKALAAVAGSGVDAAAVRELSSQLPSYTGLVETARVYNRQGLPLGSAYLREASGLMRQKLLPAAKRLYTAESASMAADRDDAATFPWLAIPLVVLLLAGLLWSQRWLSRRTNRTFNLGLLGGTAAGLVMLLWLGISWVGVFAHLSAGQANGSDQVRLLSQARIAALQARADESLTLVAHGTGGAFEADFTAMMGQLAGTKGRPGLLAQARDQTTDPRVRADLSNAATELKAWQATHTKLRADDDGGDYTGAVKLAIGSDSDSAASRFNALDGHLADGISAASDKFAAEARSAGDDLTGAGIGLGVLTLLAVLGTVVGIQQRLAEYR
jgi:hypothetical protein